LTVGINYTSQLRILLAHILNMAGVTE